MNKMVKYQGRSQKFDFGYKILVNMRRVMSSSMTAIALIGSDPHRLTGRRAL